MGLHQNGFRDNSGLFRFAGAGLSNGAIPSALPINTALTGAMRNLTAGQGITDDKVGIPLGYTNGGAWMMPQKPGNLSSTNNASASISATGLAVGGITANGEASLTFAVADAFGWLIASGEGAASITFTFADALLTASIGGIGEASFSITTNTPLLGAIANGEGSTSIAFTVANATAYPSNDASPLRNGTASFAITGTMTPYAIGSMSGSTVDSGVLTTQSIASEVWNSLSSAFIETGTMGGKLNSAASGGVDLSALAAAVLAAASATPIAANIKKINDTTVIGTGSASDTWGPA